jgi:hypothetical protein
MCKRKRKTVKIEEFMYRDKKIWNLKCTIILTYLLHGAESFLRSQPVNFAASQEIPRMKCTIIPVIIGATGIVTISLRKNLEAPGKHSIDSLQKTVVLGTSHIIRKVLQCEA